jgi:uncharacterized protein
VTAFGAFVDLGVHQDGLVHISQLADRFVRDPHEVAKVGDRIKVRVLEVDLVRKRIALTARKDGGAARPAPGGGPAGQDRSDRKGGKDAQKGRQGQPAKPFSNNPFATLLKK